MAGWTNKSFMEDLAKEYPPDFDWDAVPDPESLPPIYQVSGYRVNMVDGKLKDTEHFNIHTEFPTREAAEAQVERMKTDPKWVEAKAPDHLGRVFKLHPPSINIVEKCPEDALWLWFNKECRARILKGEEIFPMYLP